MARTPVRLPAARRWAGLLAVFTMALCIAGLAQPAGAASTDMTSMRAVAPAMEKFQGQPDGAEAQEMAAPSSPMGGMSMDCHPSALHRSAYALTPLAARLPAMAVPDAAGPVGVRRAPPSPASREGPDLDRLCVSRT
ncbi:hypothetical protein [Streptomyces mirabilis]|uniref:hypothetical protein n=1 Tax=Streptomyces mirabilis TaxID=68239 RepID=UPI0035D9A9E7